MEYLKRSSSDYRKKDYPKRRKIEMDNKQNFQSGRKYITPRNGTESMILNKIIRHKCKQAKEE